MTPKNNQSAQYVSKQSNLFRSGWGPLCTDKATLGNQGNDRDNYSNTPCKKTSKNWGRHAPQNAPAGYVHGQIGGAQTITGAIKVTKLTDSKALQSQLSQQRLLSCCDSSPLLRPTLRFPVPAQLLRSEDALGPAHATVTNSFAASCVPVVGAWAMGYRNGILILASVPSRIMAYRGPKESNRISGTDQLRSNSHARCSSRYGFWEQLCISAPCIDQTIKRVAHNTHGGAGRGSIFGPNLSEKQPIHLWLKPSMRP